MELLSVRLEATTFCPCCKVTIRLIDADASAHGAQEEIKSALKDLESQLKQLNTTIRFHSIGGTMFYLHNLRVRLQERRNRLYKTDSITYDAELRYFLQFLDENTYIRSLLATLVANTSVDFEKWISELSVDAESAVSSRMRKEEQRSVMASLSDVRRRQA